MGVRVDSWVWSVRLFPSRTKAAAACRAGRVTVGGESAHPSRILSVGDRVRVNGPQGRIRIVEVVELVAKRVGAPRAVQCYIDHSPPPPSREVLASQPRRDRGAGRPTKKERREVDHLLGR